jgi:hypothetical protein
MKINKGKTWPDSTIELIEYENVTKVPQKSLFKKYSIGKDLFGKFPVIIKKFLDSFEKTLLFLE